MTIKDFVSNASEINSANMEDLNEDCLYYILEYLPTEDSISFAQVCQRFRQLLITKWCGKFREYILESYCTRLELIKFCICREAVESLTIDLDHFDTARCFRNYGCIAPKNCFEVLCQTLLGMVGLQQLVVKQLSMLITPIEKPFDRILTAVRYLPSLRSLKLHARDDCSLERLSQLQHLENLQILVPKIPLATLVKTCKSNGKLGSLHIGYACIQKNLGDIVPHCKNLEVLKFGMSSNSSDYLPLARLPKLRELSYFGIRRSGSFEPLLSALAAKSQLTHLSIDGGSLTLQETSQLVRIQSLRYFKGFFSTTDYVEMLGSLANLEEVCISMFSPLDISHSLLAVIARCNKLKLLRIAAGNVNTKILNDAIRLKEGSDIVLVVDKVS
ncbi:uncharacterized protein LOC108113936 [Drosophila eugracilis]|uniref:uncharacterized protein LOC108113936 n=1 Tax=Drosophila eugracilis TaxID=29029 RepID=UPI0007E6E26E|nr:uncharacterized protein LOC108113936 [Drosophila eugracilis]